MSYIFYILGVAIILYALVDITWTSLWVDGGAGWLTDKLTTGIWRLILKSKNTFLLNISGALILAVTLFTWFFLLWLGATVFFAGNLDAIVNSSTQQAISWYQLPYYSGFVVFTLGIGDFTPQTPLFQLATALFSGVGMLLLTLGASYILNVVSAVVEKRTFARDIMGIGEDSIEFLEVVWDGQNFNQLDDVLADFNSKITQYTQQIQAFPLLQYYHSENADKSTTVAMAVLYEAVLVLRYGIKDEGLINTTLVDASIKSIDNFIEVAAQGYGDLSTDADTIPPTTDLIHLSHTGIPLISADYYTEKIESRSDKRSKLHKLILNDNHEWPND